MGSLLLDTALKILHQGSQNMVEFQEYQHFFWTLLSRCLEQVNFSQGFKLK